MSSYPARAALQYERRTLPGEPSDVARREADALLAELRREDPEFEAEARLVFGRDAYEVDFDAVMAAAKKHGKLLELNSNPMRLDLNDVYCAAAKQHGIPIVINTDAHSPDGLDVLRYGILQARRAGLTKADVANTRTWPQMKKLIGAK